MTAISTPRLSQSSDSLLRFALRLDATLTGLRVWPWPPLPAPCRH